MDNISQPVQNPQPESQVDRSHSSKTKLFLIGLGVLFVVGLGGAYVLGTKNNQPAQTQVAVSPTISEPTPTHDPTADWEEYINTKHGYSLKYPATGEVEVREEEGRILVWESKDKGITPESDAPPKSNYVTIERFPVPKNTSEEKFVLSKESPSGFPMSSKLIEKEDIALNGVEATEYTFESQEFGKSYPLYISHDGYLYRFLSKNRFNPVKRGFYEHVLFSFKFTDQAQAGDTANWKTYKDNKYSLVFQHPSDWFTQVRDYPENNERLINIIKEDNPTLVSLSFSIKPDWSNIGYAKDLPKNYSVGSIQAVRVDPPKKEEKTLERYQTNVYFEANGNAYVFVCTHNWDQDYINTCEN